MSNFDFIPSLIHSKTLHSPRTMDATPNFSLILFFHSASISQMCVDRDSWKYSRIRDNRAIASNPCITSRLQVYTYWFLLLRLECQRHCGWKGIRVLQAAVRLQYRSMDEIREIGRVHNQLESLIFPSDTSFINKEAVRTFRRTLTQASKFILPASVVGALATSIGN